MKPRLIILALLILALATCEKPERDNPWDDFAALSPETWAPKQMQLQNLNIQSNTLSWTFDDKNIQGFRIDRKAGDQAWEEPYASLPKDARLWHDSLIMPDTSVTYQYRLYAYAGNNKSAITGTTFIPTFPAPSNLQIQKLNDISFQLNWQNNTQWPDNPQFPQGFKIDRKIDDNDWQIAIASLPHSQTTWVDTNVFVNRSDIEIQYRLYAFYGNATSSKHLTGAQTSLSPPSNLQVNQNSITSVSLNWQNNNQGAQGFILERSYDQQNWQQLQKNSLTSYTDDNFELNTMVYYRLAAFYEDYTSTYDFTGFDAQIPAPTNLQIIQNSITSVTLSWQDNSTGEEGFSIERKQGTGNWELIANVPGTSHTDETFELNIDVFYRVAAYYYQYVSGSIENTINSQIPVPENLTFNVNNNTSVTLSWQYPYTGHEGFYLERQINDDPWQAIAPAIAPNQYNHTDNQINLEQNSYAYRLSAFVGDIHSVYALLGLSLPSLTTTAPYNIQDYTAFSGGEVTNQGNSEVTARGVVWCTTTMPSLENNDGFTTDGTGAVTFTSAITGLSAATTYYVRAYATNTAGTAYGQQHDFQTLSGSVPIVTTAAISQITASSATGGGNVTQQGDTPVAQKGVVWSTSPNPTIADNHTNDGTGTGPFTSQLTGLIPITTYYIRAYAINEAGTAYGAQVDFITGTSVVDVTNPATGKTWMDRNLGASRVAQSSTDAQAYGDLYQWGRLADGHQNRTSGTTSNLSNGNVPGHGNFILAPNSPYDWRSPQNNNLWQGVSGTNNPCPSGYRLPTEAELIAERQSWSSNNAAGAFNSPLKLPVAGYRGSSDGSLYHVGSSGHYWSATVDGTFARYLYFSSSYAGMYSSYRAFGGSVRCLKN